MRVKFLRKYVVIGISLLIILISLPNISGQRQYHRNALVIIMGKSNDVRALSIWWGIGLYIPILRRNFILSANEAGETFSAIVIEINGGTFYMDIENITVTLNHARGFFYWGGKSLLFNFSSPQPAFILCRARSVFIET